MANEYDRDEDHEEEGTVGQWLQDNLRIIISIIIVVLLAAGIYSYSQRTNAPQIADEDADEELMLLTDEEDAMLDDDADDFDALVDGDDADTDGGETKKKSMLERVKEIATGAKKDSDEIEEIAQEVMEEESTTTPTGGMSRETAQSFIQTAAPGDGLTHLARHAVANHLEKNPDPAITSPHKIYLEDYLQKNVGFQSSAIHPGTTVEFNKDLIRQSIDKAKLLSDAQLQNLQRYVALVPGL